MGNAEYTKDLEVQCAELRSVIEKMKKEHADEIIRITDKHLKEIDELNKQNKDDVQSFQEQIELLEMHISQLTVDNTVMDAQLDIVRMMCGVKE